ncbi:MAG: hypothetical protein HRT87_12670 [Legionellales bacterium]|nr:hypothetical protein [Legionellales bacterium]
MKTRFINFNNKCNYFSILKAICIIILTFNTLYIYRNWLHSHAYTEFPLIIKLIYPSLFVNDFQLNASMDSPKIVFAYINYLLTYFAPLEQTMHVASLVNNLIINSLVLLMMGKIFEVWFPRKNIVTVFILYSIVITLFLSNILNHGIFLAKPAGWRVIWPFIGSFYPAKLAFTIGIF